MRITTLAAGKQQPNRENTTECKRDIVFRAIRRGKVSLPRYLGHTLNESEGATNGTASTHRVAQDGLRDTRNHVE